MWWTAEQVYLMIEVKLNPFSMRMGPLVWAKKKLDSRVDLPVKVSSSVFAISLESYLWWKLESDTLTLPLMVT